MAMAAANATRTMTGVLAWRAEAPLEKGFVPTLAAPTGATLWEGVGLEPAAAATPGVGEPLVDLHKNISELNGKTCSRSGRGTCGFRRSREAGGIAT